MKRVLIALVSLAMVVCLFGCSGNNESSEGVSAPVDSSSDSNSSSGEITTTDSEEFDSETTSKMAEMTGEMGPTITEEEANKLYRYDVNPNGGGYRLLEYIGESKDVEVPDKIGDELVSILYDDCFKAKGLNSIKIPTNIKYYGKRCFAQNNIKKFEIGSGVHVCEGAFAENLCTGDDAFVVDPIYKKDTVLGYAGSDATVVIPDWVSYTNDKCFSNNSKIEKIVFPKSIQVIPNKSVELATLPNLKEIVNNTGLKCNWNQVFCDGYTTMLTSETGEYKNIKITKD